MQPNIHQLIDSLIESEHYNEIPFYYVRVDSRWFDRKKPYILECFAPSIREAAFMTYSTDWQKRGLNF